MWDQEGLHPSFSHPVSDTLFLVEGTFLRSSSLWRGFLGATWGAGQEAGDTDEGLWRASHKMWASRTPAHWGWHRVSWCRGLLSATGYLLGSLSLFEYRQSFLVLEGRKEDQKYLKGVRLTSGPGRLLLSPQWFFGGSWEGKTVFRFLSHHQCEGRTCWPRGWPQWKPRTVGKTFIRTIFYLNEIILFIQFFDIFI